MHMAYNSHGKRWLCELSLNGVFDIQAYLNLGVFDLIQ